jgi:hypothetical protein
MECAKSMRWCAALQLTVVVLMACTAQGASRANPLPTVSPAAGSGEPAVFTDPFAYCAAVGTIDAPDASYSGPKVPEAVAQGLRKAFGLSAAAPLEPFLHNTFWRCMDGVVYACTVGANLPCQERADTSRKPTESMTNFCQDNPQATVIPAVVTGRATVYEWTCANGSPEAVRQFAQPDARGFLSNIWHAISPPPG